MSWALLDKHMPDIFLLDPDWLDDDKIMYEQGTYFCELHSCNNSRHISSLSGSFTYLLQYVDGSFQTKDLEF